MRWDEDVKVDLSVAILGYSVEIRCKCRVPCAEFVRNSLELSFNAFAYKMCEAVVELTRHPDNQGLRLNVIVVSEWLISAHMIIHGMRSAPAYLILFST